MNNQPPSSTEENGPSELGRRAFLTASAGTIAAPLLAACSSNLLVERSEDGMIYRPLGRTGERVSVIGLGGWHIGQPSISERESIHLSARPSTEALPSWTTAGTTTKARAKSAWARP
jgi:hypothetical protein